MSDYICLKCKQATKDLDCKNCSTDKYVVVNSPSITERFGTSGPGEDVLGAVARQIEKDARRWQKQDQDRRKP
jgi:hypothetical protein